MYKTNKSSGTSLKVIQNFQNFWLLWHGRIEHTEVPGYGYERPTELTEVPGTVKLGLMHTPSGGEIRFVVEDLIQLARMACFH